MEIDSPSVVVPMHRTARALPALLERLGASLPGAEVILVDDACPERSADLALTIDHRGLEVTTVRINPNVGQHAAVLIGMSQASRGITVVMDADLQDAPEDVPMLIDHLRSSPDADAVCVARSGRYTSLARRLTAHAYRAVVTVMSRGRIPRNAGMFMVVRTEVLARIATLGDPFAPLVPALCASGARIQAVALRRHARSDGASGYRGRMRLLVALRGLVLLTPARSLVARRHRARFAQLAPTIVVERTQSGHCPG